MRFRYQTNAVNSARQGLDSIAEANVVKHAIGIRLHVAESVRNDD